MNNDKLSELLTALTDGEATISEQEIIRKASESDDFLMKALEREKKFKLMVGRACGKTKAPESLRIKIDDLISGRKQIPAGASATGLYQSDENKIPATITISSGKLSKKRMPVNGDIADGTSAFKPNRIRLYRIAAIAAIFLMALILYIYQGTGTTSASTQILEDLVYEHYTSHGGSLIPVTFIAENTLHAEQILDQDYDISLIVPELDGATFSGVVYAEFASNYHTPLLEYTVGDGDNIYVFAFCLDNLNKYGILERDDQAVSNITDINDVHIKEIGGMHVVSWKWNNVWYSAISNHDGQTIASMLPRH
jgi:hypothetical protein